LFEFWCLMIWQKYSLFDAFCKLHNAFFLLLQLSIAFAHIDRNLIFDFFLRTFLIIFFYFTVTVRHFVALEEESLRKRVSCSLTINESSERSP
jgi:hypothetical protein